MSTPTDNKFFTQGILSIINGDFPAAEWNFRQSLEIDPLDEFVSLYLSLSSALVTKDYEAFQTAVNRLAVISPGEASALLKLPHIAAFAHTTVNSSATRYHKQLKYGLYALATGLTIYFSWFLPSLAVLLVWRPRWWFHVPIAAALYVASLQYRLPWKGARLWWYSIGVFEAWLVPQCWWTLLLSLLVLLPDCLSFWHNKRQSNAPYFNASIPIMANYLPTLILFLAYMPNIYAFMLCGGVEVYLLHRYFHGHPLRWQHWTNWATARWVSYSREIDSSKKLAHLSPEKVPKRCPPQLTRILTATSYYDILGIPQNAEDKDIKKAMRSLSLITHPDKVGNIPGAQLAFSRVSEAASALLIREKREEIDALIAQFSLLNGIPDTKIMACECGSVHEAVRVDIRAEKKCQHCGRMHAVEAGADWMRTDKGLFGTRYHFYTVEEGAVYETTISALCSGVLSTLERAEVSVYEDVPCSCSKTNKGGRSSSKDVGGNKKKNRKRK